MKLNKILFFAISISFLTISCKKDKDPFNTYFEATINGTQTEFADANGAFVNSELQLVGFMMNMSHLLGVSVDKNISAGEYILGTSNQFISAVYNFDSSALYEIQSGTLNIEIHDTDERQIRGTLMLGGRNFDTNDTLNITNGSFAIEY